MNALDSIFRGVAAGLVIAAHVGPVNVFCLRQTLAKGWRSGLLCGLGAAGSDTVYGSIAAFGITFVIRFLVQQQSRIRLAGGILLTIAGILCFIGRFEGFRAPERRPARYSDLVAAFLLNLANPTVALSFLAVLAALGPARHSHGWSNVFLVGGIFSGSMIWWALLIAVAHHLRHRFTPRVAIAMNRAAGLAIGGFGVALIVLSGVQT
jgi:threonine/homoserine/homoserine lactone efflux protein